MPVPTHGPRCRTAFCHPSKCQHCRKDVYYWACTCGSSILFDALGDPWPRHKCGKDKSRILPLRSSSAGQRHAAADPDTNPMLLVECEVCGKRVRRRDLKEHQWFVHRRGMKPSVERLRNASVSALMKMAKPVPARPASRTESKKSFVACPLCGVRVIRKNLEKHLTEKCPDRKR